MKTIRVDFTSHNPELPDDKVIGCEGVHNSVRLIAVLPERMICQQIKAYTMMFCNGEGEVLYSDELLLDGNEVSCVLWQQLFVGNELSVQVQGMGFEGDEITVIDKTGIAEFQVARSLDGQIVQSDFEADGVSAQLAIVREKIALIEILGSVNGVALSKTEVNSRGELLLTYSNGKTYNVGTVKGEKGEKGLDGKDGTDGKKGKDGKDGISATHSWDGSVLTVTSASGTSSADLKGEKGENGEKGEKGDKGDKGENGYTPVKGVDYWSDDDKSEMNTHNIAFISGELAKRMQLKPEFASDIGECTDESRLYVLPDGYLYAYMLSQWSNTGLRFVADTIEVVSGNPLKGKKIVYDGDNICAGTYGGGGYARLISELTDSVYVNRGADGSRLRTKEGTGDNFRSIVDNLITLPTDGDLYCFEGGINDWLNYGILGSYDTENFTDVLDTSTVCGALETIFRFTLGNPVFASKPVCFVITHKIQKTAYRKNANGNTFKDYHDAIVGICNKYSIPYYDAFLESGLNGWNDYQSNTFLTGNESNTADGYHPNAEGYRRYYVPQLISLFEKMMPRGNA